MLFRSYTGSGYLGSAMAMDKDLTKRLVAGEVTTPRWETVTVTGENIPALVERTQLPVVVKPIASGSSIGVYIANTQQELEHALQESVKLGGRTVLEQYVSGREIQVALLEDHLPVKTDFPLLTLLVNAAGAVIIGFLAGLFMILLLSYREERSVKR